MCHCKYTTAQYASNKSKYLFQDWKKMMLPFEISSHNGKHISATQKENMLSAPNGKYSLHKTENIRYKKQKIYAVQNRKLCCTNAQKRKYTLHETENIRCTKQKMYAAQNGKYTLHKRG